MSLIDISASASIAAIFAHTIAACSPIDTGTEPSVAIGTTPEVCSIRPAPSVSTACA